MRLDGIFQAQYGRHVKTTRYCSRDLYIRCAAPFVLPSQSRRAVSSLGRQTSSIYRLLYDILLALSSPSSPLCGSLFVHHAPSRTMAPFTYLTLIIALVGSALAAPTPVPPELLQKRVTHSGRVRIIAHVQSHSPADQFDRALSSRSALAHAANLTWTATSLSQSHPRGSAVAITANRYALLVLPSSELQRV